MQSQTKRVVLALALSSVAGVAAAQFSATATVQNAVTITETTPLNFGTLFATATGLGVAAPTAANSEKVTLTTAGVITRTAATAGTPPAVQPLGGALAGVYTAPGLPSSSKVLVAILTNKDIQDDFINAGTPKCVYNTPEAARIAGEIVMTHSSGDPGVAFFCVNAFKSDVASLLVADSGTGYTLPFGVTALNFKLGATLVTQAPIGAAEPAHQFQAGVYTASFDMEVRFP